ncbi:MAG TPA: hypothetical protein VF519_09900 [Mycobacteriales bacterium]|jgi:hypothetical protein
MRRLLVATTIAAASAAAPQTAGATCAGVIVQIGSTIRDYCRAYPGDALCATLGTDQMPPPIAVVITVCVPIP